MIVQSFVLNNVTILPFALMNIISETVRKNILRPQEGWMGKEWHCQLVTSVRTQREEPHTQAGKSAVSALVQGVLPDTFKSAIST